MQKKNGINYILFTITILLTVAAVVLAQRLYQLRNEPVAPNVPKSHPKAADNPGPSASCTLNFTIQAAPTSTPTPTPPPNVTFTPAPTTTPAPPSSCGSTCDANYNQCPSDAPYCVDYEGDSKGPICGRQQIAGQGPKCETPGPGCGDLCDVNNNKCPSDAPYCVDFEGDNKAAVCGKQSIAGLGPQCNPAPTATTGQITPVIQLPPAGMTGNTIWAVIGGVAFVFLGLLFL